MTNALPQFRDQVEALLNERVAGLLRDIDDRLSSLGGLPEGIQEMVVGNHVDTPVRVQSVIIGNYDQEAALTDTTFTRMGDLNPSDLLRRQVSVGDLSGGYYSKPVIIASPGKDQKLTFRDRNAYLIGPLTQNFTLLNPDAVNFSGSCVIYITQGAVGYNLTVGSNFSINSGFWSSAPYATNILYLTFGSRDGIIDIDIAQRAGGEIQEAVFTFTDVITSTVLNYNLTNRLTERGWDGRSIVDATILVESTGIVGSATADTYAMSINSLPTGSIVSLTNKGFIVGHGGQGGVGAGARGSGGAGGNGGNALYLGHVTAITNQGIIGAGGGGAGWLIGAVTPGGNGVYPTAATITTGGIGGGGQDGPGRGGNGGALGMPGIVGQNSTYGVGGTPGVAGTAIIGSVFASWVTQGDIRGTIN